MKITVKTKKPLKKGKYKVKLKTAKPKRKKYKIGTKYQLA